MPFKGLISILSRGIMKHVFQISKAYEEFYYHAYVIMAVELLICAN